MGMSNQEKNDLYIMWSGPLGLFSVIVCGLAVITSYIFPQQRRFPNIVLVWTCIGDVALGMYVALKWIPGPVKTNFTDKATLAPGTCYFSMYFQWTMLEAAAMLSLLLAYTLYATIVKQIDLHELKHKYYYPYIAIVWIPTLLIPLFCLSERNSKLLDAGLCKMTSPHTVIFRVINLLLPLVIQMILMGQVFWVVLKVTWAVQKNVANSISSTRAILWLSCARFLGAQINELTVWLPIMYWDILNMKGIPPSDGLIIFSAVSPGFLAINGLIVMAGNKQLKLVLFETYLKVRGKFGYAYAKKNTTSEDKSISIAPSVDLEEQTEAQDGL